MEVNTGLDFTNTDDGTAMNEGDMKDGGRNDAAAPSVGGAALAGDAMTSRAASAKSARRVVGKIQCIAIPTAFTL